MLSPALRRGITALLVVGLLGGCAARPTADTDNRSGGFYGGVSGGVSRP